MGQKLWSWVIGLFVPAIIGIAAFVAALAGIFEYFPPIGNFARVHFDSLIAGAVKREIATENSELKETITKLIIAELNKESGEIPQRIERQASELFVSKLKTKIGPMVVGRFTVDSTNPEWKVDVFWTKDHSTRLWVYLEKLDNDDCILIQPPKTASGHLEKYPFRAACESDSKNLFEFDHRERVRWGNWVSLI